jgi:hypothetical protein
MLKKSFFLIFHIIVVICLGNCIDLNGQVEYQIINNQLYSKDNKIHLTVKLTNNSNTSLLMYNFSLLHEGIFKESYYTEKLNYPSGTAMFIYDKDGNRLEYQEPELGKVDFDDISDMKKRSDDAYINRMIKLKSDTIIEVSLDIDLQYYNPPPGEYNVFLIYYSGNNLNSFVPEKKVKEMEEQNNSIAFKGWIKSDTVKLIVE